MDEIQPTKLEYPKAYIYELPKRLENERDGNGVKNEIVGLRWLMTVNLTAMSSQGDIVKHMRGNPDHVRDGRTYLCLCPEVALMTFTFDWPPEDTPGEVAFNKTPPVSETDHPENSESSEDDSGSPAAA